MPYMPSEPAPTLRRTESTFLFDLMGLRPLTPADRELAFREPPYGTVEDRWHVYAEGFRARITEAIERAYPAVRRIVGAAAFPPLVLRYVRAVPPRPYDAANAGDGLPAFLESDPLAIGLPFLPDLALLERHMAEALVSRNATPLTLAELEGAAERTLALVPGTAVLRSRWPILELWRARETGRVESSRPSDLVVYRRGFTVLCEPADADEALVLSAASVRESTRGDLEARAGLAPRTFASAFGRLVERGLFTRSRRHGWDLGAT